jgi:hypothetical protein
MAPTRVKIPFLGRQVTGTVIPFETIEEHWNEYRLENGATVKLRVVPGTILLGDEKLEGGDPLVIVQSNVLVQYLQPAEEGEARNDE